MRREIYVKGHDKVSFVNKLLKKKVVNLLAFGCPKLRQIKNSGEYKIYMLTNNNVKYFSTIVTRVRLNC